MKRILIIITLLFSVNLQAANYFPIGKEGGKNYGNDLQKCISENPDNFCDDTTGKNLEYWEVQEIESQEDDKPIYRDKYKLVACSNDVDCTDKIAALNLPLLNKGTEQEKSDYSGYCDQNSEDFILATENKLMPGWSFYCTGISSYQKVTTKVLVENPTKKIAYEAVQATLNTKNAAIAQVDKAIAFGNEVKKEVYLINAAKGLTGSQLIQFMDEFSMIEKLLSVGAISNAKTQIEAIQVGPLMSATDKQSILDKINAYLGN